MTFSSLTKYELAITEEKLFWKDTSRMTRKVHII